MEAGGKSFFIAWLVVVNVLWMPTISWATPRDEATTLYKAGNALFHRGDFSGALKKYRRARKLYQSWKLDYNIAQTLDSLKRHAESAMSLELVLFRKRDIAPREVVRAAQNKLRRLKRKLARVAVSCNVKDAVVAVDGKKVGITPLETNVYMAAGTHHFTVRLPGYSVYSKRVKLQPGRHLQLSVSLVSEEAVVRSIKATDARRSRSTPIYKKWWFWTAAGVVVVGASTAAIISTQQDGTVDGTMPPGQIQLPLQR